MADFPSPEDVARRTRAAMGYANIKAAQSQERLGIPTATIARITSATSPRGARSTDELRQIADGCGVPLGFLLSGFEDVGDDADRIAALEDQVAHLNKQMPTREQLEGLIRLQLLAAGVRPAEGSAGEEPRGQLPPTG